MAMGVEESGALWMWGVNQYGELGQNNKTDYSSPKQVGASVLWKTSYGGIYASSSGHGQFTAGVKTDGTLWMWGSQTGGNLGHNEGATDYSSPKQVGTSTTWDKIYSLDTSAYVQKTDGTLWAWGWNNSGQLGQNNITQRSSPIQIPGTNWKIVSQGNRSWSTLGLKTDGSLWSWGYNYGGGLGLNQSVPQVRAKSSPTQIPGSYTWVTAAQGAGAGIKAIKTDGTLWCWGESRYEFSLGLGPAKNHTYFSSPTQIANGGTNWGTGYLADEGGQYSLGSTWSAGFGLRKQ